jgi:REP element-mobilizing transposase RayT
MTRARSQLVDDSKPGFYHCVSRCVRRAFLCGVDHYTGQSYEHRKDWVEKRLYLLADCFAVSLYAYAVMSNHLHVVLRTEPDTVASWSDEEVARRWVSAFPGHRESLVSEHVREGRVERLLDQPEKLLEIRQRLGSLSWFMRALSEPIARMANAEDGCTGRFWEGRFKSQVLLDEQAVLSCMAYVDLNPVRAGICDTLEASEHTSIKKRLEQTPNNHEPMATSEAPLAPVAGLKAAIKMSISHHQYIELVECTGRHTRPDKRGKLAAAGPDAKPVLPNSGMAIEQWVKQVLGTETQFYRAIGSARAMREAAESIGQRWLKGLSMSI